MKSEFTLALNQICSERNLPREIITQVLESALATSYRKNANIMNSQNVAVKVDIESGDMRVFVEKEVVEEVLDDRTEVSTEEAKVEKADAEIGDCIMVDVTMRDFGRIAAQNVKQMIVQKLREAERDFQYNTFAEREGEVVHGMVSNITPAGVVLNLGRAEGILPRKEQIPGERCELQQRLRAYVTEVKRSNRGPQIMLSRAHKNMLRRLLEIEVPEIQKGQVEIKSIAREPGSRSKVSVAALQAGVDPVGACVGQRGSRIQGIVNELNGEKIDVIEWSEDPAVHITKSLGPAKVLTVHPVMDAKSSKSATVVVPDDQLSLAIGREGQNARLAAKLTGWHIDIKSGSEALSEALVKLAEDERLQQSVGSDIVQTVHALRELLVRQRAVPASLSPEEFLIVKRAIDSVHGYVVAQQAIPQTEERVVRVPETSAREKREAKHAAAVAAIPRAAYSLPVEKLDVSPRVAQRLASSGLLSIGQLMERQLEGDDSLLAIEGIGVKALSEIKGALDKALDAYGLRIEPQVELVAPAEPEVALEQVTEDGVAVVIAEPMPVLVPQSEDGAAAGAADVADAAAVAVAVAVAVGGAAEVVPEPVVAAPEEGKPLPVAAAIAAIDDDGRSPEEIFLEAMAEGEEEEGGLSTKEGGKKKDKDKDKKKGGRDRVLIYDEELGRTVVQRSRKPGRAGDEVLDGIEEE